VSFRLPVNPVMMMTMMRMMMTVVTTMMIGELLAACRPRAARVDA
jgi:hypothetical protein